MDAMTTLGNFQNTPKPSRDVKCVIVGSINGSTLNKLIQKVYQRNLVLFFMLINIVKVSFILTIRNGSFSRCRPRWLPRAIIVDIQGIIQPRKMLMVSNRRI